MMVVMMMVVIVIILSDSGDQVLQLQRKKNNKLALFSINENSIKIYISITNRKNRYGNPTIAAARRITLQVTVAVAIAAAIGRAKTVMKLCILIVEATAVYAICHG